MAAKNKPSARNLKINTRIIWSAVISIIIPTVIIAGFSSFLFTTVSRVLHIPSAPSNSYSLISLFQWDRELNALCQELEAGGSAQQIAANTRESIAELESVGTGVYIEAGGEEIYSTGGRALERAEAVAPVTDSDRRVFSDTGLVLVKHVNSGANSGRVVLVNEDFTVSSAGATQTADTIINLLLGRTGIIILIIVTLFILSTVISSFITSRTIVGPIKKIAHGADEIARGNLDYVIDYESTNELGQTADSFNEMGRRLKESINRQYNSIEERNVLIAGIAHDLRTPLTSAKGYAEGLLDGIAGTPEKQEQYLRTICSSINQTEKILDDLLTVSRLSLKSYQLSREDIDIAEFLTDGAEEIRNITDSNGFDFSFTLNCRPPVIVSLDTDAFARVISNIIMNSIKYARDDVRGEISMSLNEYERSVIIEIADNGIGVDRESLSRIFDTMYRADPARSKVSQGSGLGLSVCKQVVELHGGTIWARSREGEGLTVFISLPKVAKEETAE
jgi:signal transduction histidine kinase